jgi:hypothetical protein
MTEPRLYEIPDEVQLDILFYLSVQSLIRLYQTSHYWKRRISNDKQLWRSVYERDFGREFAKDRWILWAVRRLWSQSLSEEKRLAARRVNLTTLEHLDGYTWYRLVRGRVLTIRNWMSNTPQRIVIFPEDQHNIFYKGLGLSNLSYGIPFVSDGNNKLGFSIIDDTLDDTQTKRTLSLQTHDINLALGRTVSIYSTSHIIVPLNHVTSDEFVIARKHIHQQDAHIPIVILVWNIGHLEMCNTEHQSYYVPSLCMAELLPHGMWFF